MKNTPKSNFLGRGKKLFDAIDSIAKNLTIRLYAPSNRPIKQKELYRRCRRWAWIFRPSRASHADTEMTEHDLHVQESIRQSAVQLFSEAFSA